MQLACRLRLSDIVELVIDGCSVFETYLKMCFDCVWGLFEVCLKFV